MGFIDRAGLNLGLLGTCLSQTARSDNLDPGRPVRGSSQRSIFRTTLLPGVAASDVDGARLAPGAFEVLRRNVSAIAIPLGRYIDRPLEISDRTAPACVTSVVATLLAQPVLAPPIWNEASRWNLAINMSADPITNEIAQNPDRYPASRPYDRPYGRDGSESAAVYHHSV